MKNKLPLPIDPYVEEIVKDSQNHSTLLIKASPGSGKTTRLPWAIAAKHPGKVLVLEPRRLAARLAAERIAFEENLNLGSEVGYHFRFEKKLTTDSKLIFYTEGTFLKTLAGDPELANVSTVILDEFHERHLETDVALAALRALQKKNGLKLILMSATLDTRIHGYFENPKTIEIEAPRFKVDVHFLPNVPSVLNETLEQKVKKALLAASPEGHVLVFLPGMREQLRVKESLGDNFGSVYLLHGELSREEQEGALSPSEKRKIILATNIAESSVTIPGIRVVIDSGIQREAQYSPWTGLKTLVDRPITQSSAIQRAGRAGRTADGECRRLYSQQDYNEREEFTIPEILKADLTDTYLLARGLNSGLDWFTPPPPERWKKARELCAMLGLVDAQEKITTTAKQAEAYPVEARLARTLIAGEALQTPQKKALLNFICEEIEKDQRGTLKRRLDFFLKHSGTETNWEKSLLTGFVDQVARYRRKQNDFIHYSGKTLKAHPSLRELAHDFYLILDVTPRQEAFLVVPIEEEWLFDLEPFPFMEEDVVSFDDKLVLKRLTKLGSLVLEESSLVPEWNSLKAETRTKLLELAETPFRKKLLQLQQEKRFTKLDYLIRLKNKKITEIEFSPLDYFTRVETTNLDQLPDYFYHKIETDFGVSSRDLPDKIDLGGKRELTVHYPPGMDPYVEAPIQDFYGQKKTPSLPGNIPLTLKLLGPHKMPIQVTKDLANFWVKMYPEMKKEWMREYPRHHWPEDPASAKPILLKRQL